MLESLDERQKHLDLNSPCIKIGGVNSTEYRGLLAHFLETTIPTRVYGINLCHKCGNHGCSNVKHLYWGTLKENLQDSKDHGTYKSMYESTIKKYGEKEAKKMFKTAASKGGKKGGGNNKLSKEKIDLYKSKILESKPETYGWIARAGRSIGISHTQVRRFYNKHIKN